MGLILFGATNAGHQSVLAEAVRQPGPPVIPARVFGAVEVDNQSAPEGIRVEALIDNVSYATTNVTTSDGQSIYAIEVPGDDPTTEDTVEGGREGDTIVFMVDGVRANETASWRSGELIELDLTVTATPTPITPIPKPSTPVTIPEPVSIVLFGIGLAGLAAWRAGGTRTRQ